MEHSETKSFKATLNTIGFTSKTWVIKRHLNPERDIESSGESVFQHARKQIQVHSLSEKFAKQLANKAHQITGF